jgi:hypothetical protein
VGPGLLPLLGLLTGAACGKDKALEGSLSPLMDLHYEQVKAQVAEGEVSVSFVKPKGAGEDTVLKVSARMEGLAAPEPEPGVPIDLAELLGEDGPTRGTVSRSVLDEPTRDFPPITRGTLTFDGYLDPGTTVTGEFHVTFANGTDVYSGRTVFGRFEATVP